jgi:chemotaxis protein methyltransferase CheR
MIERATDVDAMRFRDAIARAMGLAFDDAKLPYLSEVLTRRTTATKTSIGPYLDAIEEVAISRAELREIAAELTIGETYFFRHVEQFRAFEEIALPDRLRARAAERTLSILCAGCSSGEEPYSLAILLEERLPRSAADTSAQPMATTASTTRFVPR